MTMLHLQGHMTPQWKEGISKASEHTYLQAEKFCSSLPFNYLAPFWDEKSGVPSLPESHQIQQHR